MYFSLVSDTFDNEVVGDEDVLNEVQYEVQYEVRPLLTDSKFTKEGQTPDSWILEKVCGKKHQIRIKHSKTGEYLYAGADDLVADPKRRRVFTWTNTTTSPNSDPAYWDRTADWLIWEEEGNGFILKNVKFSEYLYAASDDLAFDESNRSVFTWKQYHSLGIEGFWKFNKDIRGNLLTLFSND